MKVDVLNINILSEPNGEIETRLAKKMYKTRIDKRFDPRVEDIIRLMRLK